MKPEPQQLSYSQSLNLQSRLVTIFELHGVDVAVGLKPGGGVAIRSQDENVDAQNIGLIGAQTGRMSCGEPM